MFRLLVHGLLALTVLSSACAPTPSSAGPAATASYETTVAPLPSHTTFPSTVPSPQPSPPAAPGSTTAPTRVPTAAPEAARPTAIPAPNCSTTAPPPVAASGEYVTAVAAAPERAWAAVYSPALTRTTIYISDDAGRTWASARFSNEYVNDIVASPVYTRDASVFAVGSGGVYRSFNGGTSWAGLTPSGWYTTGIVSRHFALSPSFGTDRLMLFASASAPRGVYASFDGGASWRDWLVDAVDGLFVSPNYGIDRAVWASRNDALTFRRDVMVTTTQGDTWEFVHAGSAFPAGVSPAYAQDSTIFWRDLAGALYVSRNSDRVFPSIAKARAEALAIWQRMPGQGWVTAGDYPVRAVAFSTGFGRDRTAFALADSAPLVTRDGGLTWQPLCYWSADPQAAGAPRFNRLAVSPDSGASPVLIAGGTGARVAVSRDGGQSWSLVALK
ncbi:MAG: exo-alpha-sialidase [Chloroflexi bacterium]|nr:exo-alpha-sialidase [Chloroflexota bacterium]